MTRTRSNTGPKNTTLQPTKLSLRRGDASSRKKDDLTSFSNGNLRNIFQKDSLEFLRRVPTKAKENGICRDGEDFLKDTNEPVKVGLGPVFFNLKPHHYHNNKKSDSEVNKAAMKVYMRVKFGAPKKNEAEKNSLDIPVIESDDEFFESTLKPLCYKMGKVTILQNEDEEDKLKGSLKSDTKLATSGGLMGQSFKRLVSETIAYEAGEEITLKIDQSSTKTFKKSSSAVRKAGVRNWKSPEVSSSDIHCGLLKNLLVWSLPTSTRWKEVEDRLVRWTQIAKEGKAVGRSTTVEEIATQLNITVDDLKNLQFHKDLKQIFQKLKNQICHSSIPWLSSLMAVSELQQGNLVGATKNATDSQGTFLHSEIVDKHICYLSRSEESKVASSQRAERSSFSTKAELFRKQIHDTLRFGGEPNSAFDDTSAFTEAISALNPDWNIIQITALLHSKNRFGMDLYGRRQIPQLLLSAMAHVHNEKERSCFTTFCQDPPVHEGSMMRLGLMEEFQRILDQNLVISDDSIVISRRNYWEERSKHNEAMMSIIEGMEEDWIGPWNFLLPGHTTHRDLQAKIHTKIIAPTTKKYKLTSAQKLVLYKLTENYKYLHRSISSSLETVVAFILNSSENGLSALCKKIKDIGSEVPPDNRHPTILVIDQDLEIYPWESMNCLVNTDVTRMPSLNLIRSNYNFVSSLRPTYPDIVDSSKCTFVLNPDGTLPNVQKRLEWYLLEHQDWVPVIARPPSTTEVQECLENQHIFLYNGHGAGSNFYPEYAVQKLVCQAVPLLMGCASAQAHYAVPRIYGSHTIHSYFLAGCPSVVGYLWEITDAECDRITADLIERWLPDEKIRPPNILFFDQDAKREREKGLSTAMRISRKAATQFLTQCAIVCYGLPINTQQ